MAEKNLRSLKFPGSDDVYKIAQPDYAQTDSTQPDFIKNKIVGDVVEYGDTLAWDGDTTGLECVNDSAYKVYDFVPSLEEIQAGGVVTALYDGEIITVAYTADDILHDEELFMYYLDGTVLFVYQDSEFANKGLYFIKMGSFIEVTSLTIHGYSGFATKSVKKLDKKYFDVEWDNVKDKPFGIDWDNPTVLVENKTYSLNLDGIETSDFVLKTGPFKVVFDNVEYIREICEMEVQGLVYKIVGNLAMLGLGDDSGEPFVMASVPDLNITIIAGNDGDHLISVYEAAIIKIPEKFIPNILNKTVFCFNLDDTSDCYIYKDLDCTLKATREELLMALRTSAVCYGYPGVVECQALFFNDLFNKCMVLVIDTASNTFSPRMLYTAEYTP